MTSNPFTKSTPRTLGVLAVAGVALCCTLRFGSHSQPQKAIGDPKGVAASLQSVPLSFEPTRGQTPRSSQFVSRGAGYGLFLSSNEAVVALLKPGAPSVKGGARTVGARPVVLRMKLAGARADSAARPENRQPGISNYFLGNNRKQWRTNVPNFARVRYPGVYPGVDVVYYGNQRQLEYDFVVAPGSDPAQIRMQVTGADTVRVARNGNLELVTSAGIVEQKRPVAYQEIQGKRTEIASRYTLSAANEVGFELAGYDRSKPLVIDPVLAYSTFFGGDGRDVPTNIAVDADGNTYVTGVTLSSNFQTQGPIQGNLPLADAFVSKFSNNGQSRVYSTYLGGNGNENVFTDPVTSQEVLAGGIALDNNRNAYVVGYTESTDFPLIAPIQVRNAGNGDGFIVRLNAAGNGITYSTYLGGRGLDAAHDVAVADSADGPNPYIVGQTNSPDFNVVNAFQPLKAGAANLTDAFMTRLNAAGSGTVYSTYLGGDNTDRAVSVAVDGQGAIYLTGVTLSGNYPTTTGVFQQNNRGSSDAFVTKFTPNAQSLAYSSFLGGSGENAGMSIAVDQNFNAYVGGFTTATDFVDPMAGIPYLQVSANTPGDLYNGSIYGGRTGAQGGISDGFVVKVNSTGTALLYNTYIGGDGQDVITAVGISTPASGSTLTYATGFTTSNNFPVVDALRTSRVGAQDAIAVKIRPNGDAFEYSTYLGGSSDDIGTAVGVDGNGNAYVVGATNSADYPTLLALTPTYLGGTTDAFSTKLSSPPGAPQELVASNITPTSVDLDWLDSSDNESGFRVERRTLSTGFTVIATLASNTETYTDNGLTPRTTYIYRVQAFNAVGSSAYSNSVQVDTPPVPPAAPSNLAVTVPALPFGFNELDLTWADNSNTEDGFRVEISTDGATFTPIANGNNGVVPADTTSVRVNNLQTFTTYFFRVVAFNGGGDSAASNTASNTTRDTPPSAPSGLTAAAISNSEIALNWSDNSDNETGFEVQRSTNGINFTVVTTVNPDQTFFLDTALNGNTTYTYQVRAVNSGGFSGFTNLASATTRPDPPVAASNLVVTVPAAPAGISQLNLTWNDNSLTESGFKIERAPESTIGSGTPGTFALIATVGQNRTSYTDSANLQPATVYFYRVTAFNAGGDGPASNIANGRTLPTPPTAPSSLTATTVSQTQIVLNWADNSSNEANFEVFRSTDGTNFTSITTTQAGINTYADNGLTANTTYFYRVRAVNMGGNSAFSNTAQATTLPNPPAAPTNVTATLTGKSQVTVAWTDLANNETGFKVERAAEDPQNPGQPGTFGLITTTPANQGSYIDVSVQPDTRYFYRVSATNLGGDSFPATAAASSVLTPPAAPTNLTATEPTNSEVRLFFIDKSKIEDGFRIQRRTAGGMFATVASAPPSTPASAVDQQLSYLDTGLSGATEYTYRVVAYSNATVPFESDPTEELTIITDPNPPTAPSNLTATAVSRTQINLTYVDNSDNETSFAIERAVESSTGSGTPGTFIQIAGAEPSQVGTGGTLTYQDSGLVANTLYFYRVTASNAGGTSSPSNVAQVRTFPFVPSSPTNLRVTVQSASSLRLDWTDNSNNEDGFKVERSENGVDFTQVATRNVNQNSYVDSGLDPNTEYTYRVRAFNLGGDSGFTNSTLGLTLPGAVTDLTATPRGDGSVRLDWTLDGGADGFKIEFRSGTTTTFREIATVGGASESYVHTGLVPNTPLFYRVRGFNRSGNGPDSNIVSTTALAALQSLTINKSSVKGGGKFLLTVRLTAAAPAGGAVIDLSANNTIVPVPATITIPSGQTSASVQVKTKKTRTNTSVTITATYNEAVKAVILQVKK